MKAETSCLKTFLHMINNNNRHHINLNVVNTDEIIRISACMSDTILKPLYEFVNRRNMNGYIGALDIICQWAKEFYQQYYSKMKDWDSFEESADNVYNSMCWDDFLIDWTNDRFKKFKSETDLILPGKSTDQQFYASSKIPRLIIVIKNHTVSSVYSNKPVQIARVDYDDPSINKCPLVGIFEADTIADDLVTVFDSDDPQQRAIQEELISHGF